jgi:hypothetical protein
MSVVSNLFNRLTRTVKNVGRRTRKVGRNSARVARKLYKPVTNMLGLTKKNRKSRGRKSRK